MARVLILCGLLVFEHAALGCRKPPPEQSGGGFRFGTAMKTKQPDATGSDHCNQELFQIVKSLDTCCICRIPIRIIRFVREKADKDGGCW